MDNSEYLSLLMHWYTINLQYIQVNQNYTSIKFAKPIAGSYSASLSSVPSDRLSSNFPPK